MATIERSDTVITLTEAAADKIARLQRGLTQEEFSEQSGISYKYYQAVEAGRKKDLRLTTLE